MYIELSVSECQQHKESVYQDEGLGMTHHTNIIILECQTKHSSLQNMSEQHFAVGIGLKTKRGFQVRGNRNESCGGKCFY